MTVSSLPLKIHHNSAGHWGIRAFWVLATILFVLYIPTKAEDGTVGDMTFALQLAIAAMALNLVMGFGGIISLGHSAYFGLGGYATAVLVDHYGWSQGWTFFVAAILGFVIGCATSLPALRLKGVYLALVTLGLAVLFPQLVKWQKAEWLTDGARGIDDLGYDDVPTWPILGELRREEGRAVFMWWVTVIVVVLAYLVCRGIVKSRVGRSLIAIRDNETAAAVMGVNTARTKTLVFGVSASMCAVGGSLFAVSGKLVNPDLRFFTLIGSIIFLLVMVLGGAATLWGPIVGAVVYVVIETRTREAAADERGRPRLAVRLDERLAGVADPRNRAPRDDVPRPVRHHRAAQAPRREVRRPRSEPRRHRKQRPADRGRRGAVAATNRSYPSPQERPHEPSNNTSGCRSRCDRRWPSRRSASATPAPKPRRDGRSTPRTAPTPTPRTRPSRARSRIGSAMPLSGPVARRRSSRAARGFQAYVEYANANELLPGVTIEVDIQDDQYDPSLTPGVVQGLIDSGVHLFAGNIGTAQNLTVRRQINEECIPHLNLLTGDPAWGDVEEYPWTTGLLTPYNRESQGYADEHRRELPRRDGRRCTT